MHIVIVLRRREWLVGWYCQHQSKVMQYDIFWINLFQGWEPFLLPDATFS